ncbi:MAG: 1,4-alpha-glucan branching protein GlgB [Synergistales bacterium]|nr:1,4-alpha-glucan branching protein GlgB [Synergistales bacterium]
MTDSNNQQVLSGHSLLTEQDIYLFKEGRHTQLYDKMGAHPCTFRGRDGVQFALWAPNARAVSVVGEWNRWTPGTHQLTARGDESGIWEGFLPDVGPGELYKYHIESRYNGFHVDKGDPFAFRWELSPRTASIIHSLEFPWQDERWLETRRDSNTLEAPMSVYECHLGSWMQKEGSERHLGYREIAPLLASHLHDQGFTHVEFLPIMEHPFYGSWGYQTLGYFAPTSRYGTPEEFMYLVDYLHNAGIGVLLDWVPSHFPGDEHGLIYFDGTHLYEHADPRKGFHPHWKSYIFNLGRNEVRSFLLSSAHFWIDRFHADGLRIDAVASMLYLDYGREGEDWIPNEYGGREDLESIAFLRDLNESLYRDHPGIQTIAEESTAWPMVSQPVYVGGLGFGMKWNMGWMHDTLDYFNQDPIFRKYHHGELTFSIMYAFSENFMLPLSHDEVVHGKGSLLGKMPGDRWRRFANLRLLYGYMFTHPGKKLLFMGGEFGQEKEWNHEEGLQWELLEDPMHTGLLQWLRELNTAYRANPALHAGDFDPEGFRWIDCDDVENSVFTYLRSTPRAQPILVACNCTPMPRQNYRIGVPSKGRWKELLNSDGKEYGGSGQGNFGGVATTPIPYHGYNQSLTLTLPPLATLIMQLEDTTES